MAKKEKEEKKKKKKRKMLGRPRREFSMNNIARYKITITNGGRNLVFSLLFSAIRKDGKKQNKNMKERY